MFTGLIETIGKVKEVKKMKSKMIIGIKIKNFEDVVTGDSISCNGVCSTVINIKNNIFYFEYMAETLKKTYFKKLEVRDNLNIEKSLGANERFAGHFVQGHVDDVGKIKQIQKNDKNVSFRISYSQKFDNYIIEKGSIAIDGISLTVTDINKNSLGISLISHTMENTNLKNKKVGDPVNIEYDLIGKYLYKFYKNTDKKNSSNLREVLKKW